MVVVGGTVVVVACRQENVPLSLTQSSPSAQLSLPIVHSFMSKITIRMRFRVNVIYLAYLYIDRKRLVSVQTQICNCIYRYQTGLNIRLLFHHTHLLRSHIRQYLDIFHLSVRSLGGNNTENLHLY